MIKNLCAPELVASIDEAVQAVTSTYASGGKAIFFGNGGSAADAIHLAAELLGRFLRERRPLAALALADNHSAITAISNDYGYHMAFARQIEALPSSGDVPLGFSTSGRSENVAHALATARERDVSTIALTGIDPGRVGACAQVVVAVPSAETPPIQQAHMLIGHVLCDRFERTLLP